MDAATVVEHKILAAFESGAEVGDEFVFSDAFADYVQEKTYDVP